MPQDEREFLEKLAEFNAEHGKPPPKDHVEIPPVLDCYADLWECFMRCSQGRVVGMDVSGIPPSEVESWCRTNRVPTRRRALFLRVVAHLDAVWRECTRAPKGRLGK